MITITLNEKEHEALIQIVNACVFKGSEAELICELKKKLRKATEKDISTPAE